MDKGLEVRATLPDAAVPSLTGATAYTSMQQEDILQTQDLGMVTRGEEESFKAKPDPC